MTDRLTLVSAASGTAHVAVHDAGRLDDRNTPPERGTLLAVLRGPCYLGLHSLVTHDVELDGIVLVAEPGRSLTRRDVADVCGAPVVAEIPASPRVARTIDAGLFVTRLHRLSELASLRRYLTRTLLPRIDPRVQIPAPRPRKP